MKKTINERLIDIRKQLKIGQKEMSSKLNVSQSYYSDIENGRRSVSNKFIEKICNELNVSKVWLLTELGDMFNTKKEYLVNPLNAPFSEPLLKGAQYSDPDAIFYLSKIMAFDREFEKHISENDAIKMIDSDTKEILMFRIPYYSIMKKLINPAQNIVDYKEFNKLSFTELKKLKLENLEKLIPHKDTIAKLANAMREFISEMDESGEDWLDFTENL